MSRPTRRLVLAILASFLVMIWLSDLLVQVLNVLPFWMDDAQTYAVGGRHLLTGQPIYAAFQLAGPYGLGAAAWGRGFAYPPTAALLFAPISGLDSNGLGVLFTAALAVLGLLAYRVGILAGLATAPAAIIALLVTFSGPAINAWSSGNVNLLVADALLASWLWPRSSGYLAVLGGLVKFFPAAGLVWTARKHAPLILPIALGMGAVALATLVAGTAGWHDFMVAFANGRSSSFFPLPSPAQLLGPGIGTVAGYGLTLLALLGTWRVRDERLAFALLGWAMILPAPDWWSHYLIVPLAALLPWICGALYPILARGMSPSRSRLVLPTRES